MTKPYITIANADFARDWWSDDRFRTLPGEEDQHTVYVIDFYDQCKYFGYTKEPVFYRAISLAAHIDSWAPDNEPRPLEEHILGGTVH